MTEKVIYLHFIYRYKIFLGANLTDTFLNVGDGSGQGEDHCQLVGGLDSNAVLPGDHSNAPSLTGISSFLFFRLKLLTYS